MIVFVVISRILLALFMIRSLAAWVRSGFAFPPRWVHAAAVGVYLAFVALALFARSVDGAPQKLNPVNALFFGLLVYFIWLLYGGPIAEEDRRRREASED
jgi:hypothetical protein